MKIECRDGITKLYHGHREQSAWSKDRPDILLHSYIQLMALAALTWSGYQNQRRGRALIIGLGGGILCRFLLRHFPGVSIEVVEPDARVIEYAQSFFDLPSVVKIHHTDGRTFISGRTGTYDLIFIDAFDRDYIPAELTTCEFLAEIRKRLRKEGLVVTNTWILDEMTDHENATYALLFEPLFDLRLIFNIEGNRILLFNDAIKSRIFPLMDTIAVAAYAAERRAGANIFSGLRSTLVTRKLHRELVITTPTQRENGLILHDANVQVIRSQCSFNG